MVKMRNFMLCELCHNKKKVGGGWFGARADTERWASSIPQTAPSLTSQYRLPLPRPLGEEPVAPVPVQKPVAQWNGAACSGGGRIPGSQARLLLCSSAEAQHPSLPHPTNQPAPR